MTSNYLVDETLTSVTPYRRAVMELYKKMKEDKSSIEVDMNDEYMEKLRTQLQLLKDVINTNIEKASKEKAALEAELDKLDEEVKEDAIDIAANPEDVEKALNDEMQDGLIKSHKLDLLDEFLEAKRVELKAIDDILKEVDEKSDALKNAILSSKLIVNMIRDITKNEEMVSQWNDDFAEIKKKSEEDGTDDWVTILKYCTMTKVKHDIIELQHSMNKTVKILHSYYNEYVKDEDAEKFDTIPDINWYGVDREARYKEFDTVIQYMRDRLHKTYLENQANLSNEKLKEIKSVIFDTDYLCLSKELRDTRLMEAFAIPDPVERYSYRVNILTKPIIVGLYSNYIENAYEFTLYTLSIIREPNAFWLVFLLAGEM